VFSAQTPGYGRGLAAGRARAVGARRAGPRGGLGRWRPTSSTVGQWRANPDPQRVSSRAAGARPMGNREIAQARFITTKTVSDHRSSAYRKLNIQSRDQLATVMSAEQIVP
jgi:hypothetical protein